MFVQPPGEIAVLDAWRYQLNVGIACIKVRQHDGRFVEDVGMCNLQSQGSTVVLDRCFRIAHRYGDVVNSTERAGLDIAHSRFSLSPSLEARPAWGRSRLVIHPAIIQLVQPRTVLDKPSHAAAREHQRRRAAGAADYSLVFTPASRRGCSLRRSAATWPSRSLPDQSLRLRRKRLRILLLRPLD